MLRDMLQGLEAVHSALRRSDERHGLRVVNEIGTPYHIEMSMRSVALKDKGIVIENNIKNFCVICS